jgi:hypothetical protein
LPFRAIPPEWFKGFAQRLERIHAERPELEARSTGRHPSVLTLAIEEEARALGKSANTIRTRWHVMGANHADLIPAFMLGAQPGPQGRNMNALTPQRLVDALGRGELSTAELAARLGAPAAEIMAVIEAAQAEGFAFALAGGRWRIDRAQQPAFIGRAPLTHYADGAGWHRFGAVSDNHMCFPPSTRIETAAGSRRISQVKVGDLVLTHQGRYRPVQQVLRSRHDGTFTKIRFRGQSAGGSDAYASLVCTPNHPVLVVREGHEGFLPASEIRPGDAVRQVAKKCARCDTPIPFGMRVCEQHDPYVRPVSDARHRQRYEQQARSGGGSAHWQRDILPEMERWAAEGFRVIPMERVRPDFIAIRDGKVIAVEVEAPEGKRPRPIAEKYDWTDHRRYYDDVRWVEIDGRRKTRNRTYRWLPANEEGFIAFEVSAVESITVRPAAVYNLVVAEDGTYVAKRCVVHNCSKYSRLDVIEALYDQFAAAGITRVYNAGNWIDGEASFNRHDLVVHGMDAQCRYLAEHYPRRDGITTYAVAGDDHEGWYAQREGVDIGRYAERVMRDAGRTDWVDLGYMEAPVLLQRRDSDKASVLAAVHPGGGSSYALSYSIQKIIESLDGGEKPAIGLYGHYHKLWAGNIRNVWCVQTGCTQDQTPFMRKKKLEAHVGGAIVEAYQCPETGAILRCRVELLRFFNKGFATDRWSHAGPVVHGHRA